MSVTRAQFIQAKIARVSEAQVAAGEAVPSFAWTSADVALIASYGNTLASTAEWLRQTGDARTGTTDFLTRWDRIGSNLIKAFAVIGGLADDITIASILEASARDLGTNALDFAGRLDDYVLWTIAAVVFLTLYPKLR